MAGTKTAGHKERTETGILPGERPASEDTRLSLSIRRALVVTSDAGVLDLCQQVCETTTYVVDHVDFIEDIEIVVGRSTGIVFLDCPSNSGEAVNLLRRLRSVCSAAATVLLAEHLSPDELLWAMQNGAVDWITKPPGRERLRQAVLRAANVDERNREYAALKAFSPLFEVGNDINSSLDLDEVLASTARHAARLANAHASHIVLLDPNGQAFTFRAGHGDRERWEDGGQITLRGPAQEAVSANRCLSIPDLVVGTFDECRSCAGRHGLCSSLWIPLVNGDRSIGAISVCSKTPSPVDREVIDVLRALASYAATAVERARLYQELRRGLEKLDTLYNINRAVGSSFDLNEVMNAILRVESVLPYDSAGIFILDERENRLRMEASRNLDAELQATTSFDVGEGIVGWVAAYAESLNVADTTLDTRYQPRGMDNARSILAVPLRAGGKVIAVLCLARYRVNAFTDEEERLAELISSQAAHAMRNAQLYQNACQLLQEESGLYSLVKIVNNSSTNEELLSKAAPLLAETLRSESCIICLINPTSNNLFLARTVGITDPYVRQIADTVEDWAIHRQVLASQEPAVQLVRRAAQQPKRECLLLGPCSGLVSVLSAPLTIRQKTLGVITVARRATYGVHSHGDKDLLTNLASQLSVAIEELRLRAHDLLTLYELSQFSGTTLNLEEIYRRTLSKVEPLFDCEGLCLLLFEPASERFEIKCAIGSARESWKAMEKISPDVLDGHASNDHKPLAFSLARGARRLSPWQAGGGAPIVVAPMVVEGSLIGALALRLRGDQLPSEDRRVLLASLAVQAALVIRNATLYAASQELAIAEERNRIAREFHDGVTQNLAHLMLKMQLIARLLDIDKGRAKDELERSRQVLEESVKELRRCIYALRPVHLEGTGLSQALERIATEFAEQSELEAFLDLEPVTKLPSRVEAAVFRVVQEALNNIRKHAQAHRFSIQLKLSEGQMHLVIQDDGIGFDCDGDGAARTGHFGLPQMKERAGELGGYLVVRSSPGEGTSIEAWIPVSSRGKLGRGLEGRKLP